MPHKIEISDKTYEELKEYCTLNKLKIGQYADKLVHEGLMIEMYGDTPFTDYRRKIMKEFPPEKFQEEYLAQPEPIPTPEEPPEVPFMLPFKTDEPDKNGRVYTEEGVKKAVEEYNKKTKIITRRLK